MHLRVWLAINKLTAKEFANRIDYHPHYVQGVKAGNIKAGAKLARLIERSTQGQVSVKDIQDAYQPKLTDQRKQS